MMVREVDKAEWKDYVDRCPQATFFHTYEWYRIWEAYAKYKAKALMFEFPSGHTALLPLSERRIHKGLTRMYDSSPAGTFGGFVSSDLLNVKEVTELESFVGRMTINITFNPYQLFEGWEETMKTDFTQRICLKTGVDKKKWDDYNYYKKKAKINQLKTLQTSKKKDWEVYYGLYEKSLARWGNKASSRYGKSLFEYLQELGLDICQLWLVYYEDKPIYGGVYFSFNGIITQWHAAGDKDFYKFHPAYFLHEQVIDYALKNSFRYYDFNPSGGHKGVERFKENFRPTKVYFPVLSNTTTWYSILDHLSNVLKNN